MTRQCEVPAERTAMAAPTRSVRQIVADAARRARVALLYATGYLVRRNRGRWVFGNHKGFRDNPRYLAEHIVHHCPGLEAWWIARSSAESAEARGAGLHVAVRGERGATRVQRTAGVAFLTHGFADLEAAHLGGAFVVDLGHGKGLKRVLLDMPESPSRSRRQRLARRLSRWLIARRLAQIDLVVAPGEMARSMYASAYRRSTETIPVLGSPRFDVIVGTEAFARAGGAELEERLGISPDDFVVLWLPTWRDEGDAGWLPPLTAQELESALGDTRVVIVVKPHPFSDHEVFQERLPQHPSIRLLRDPAIDPNALLRAGAALVTDYSSVAFDYALLDRPIFFLAPDLDVYRAGAGLYEPLETISGGRHHRTWSTLLPALRRASLGDDAHDREVARRIAGRAANRAEPGSSARIAEAVAEMVGVSPR